jgi:hypothetical protein
MSKSKNFELKNDRCYFTPVTLTDSTIDRNPSSHYENNTRHCISYLTDHDALCAFCHQVFPNRRTYYSGKLYDLLGHSLHGRTGLQTWWALMLWSGLMVK